MRGDTCHGRGWEGWTCSHEATPGPLHGSGCPLAWMAQGLWPEGQRDGRLTYLGSWCSSLPPRAWLTRGTRICLRRKRAGGLWQYLGWSPHAALPRATVDRAQRYSQARPSGLSSRVLLWTQSHLCPPVTQDTRVNNAESSAAGPAPLPSPSPPGICPRGTRLFRRNLYSAVRGRQMQPHTAAFQGAARSHQQSSARRPAAQTTLRYVPRGRGGQARLSLPGKQTQGSLSTGLRGDGRAAPSLP